MTSDPASAAESPDQPVPLLDMLDLHTVDDPSEPDHQVADGDLVVTGTHAIDVEVDLQHLCEVALSVLSEEGVGRGRLDLHLVDEDAIAELNVEHMGGEGPTDVLAFPLDSDDAVDVPDQVRMLGDVVVCPAVAGRQAAEHTGSLGAELTLLVIHGVLHVLGHDHAEPAETERMRGRERVHLERRGLEHPVAPS